jgi:PucR family transcriptional regulator, purine catabolism regulatory protein
MHSADAGIYQILLRHPNTDDLWEFMSRTLGALIRYDLETQSQLVHTLHIYLAHGGNMRTAATQLNLHYNSIRYRLQRIREILGDEWEQPSERLNVEIGLKILSLHVPSMTHLSSVANRL